jgi:hypothetical protein
MKFLFVISPDFVHWPLEISKYIKRKNPDSFFCGMLVAPDSTLKIIQNQMGASIAPLYKIDDLEQVWLNTPADIEKLKYYESILGCNIINELIISDRYLGSEYVSGGIQPNTPLTKLSRTREKQLSYINGLLDFLFDFLEKENPDIIFSPAVASAPTLALAKVAKYLNINFSVINATRFQKLFILDSSPYLDAPVIKELFFAAKENNKLISEHIDAARISLSEFRKKPSPPEYWDYWKSFIKNPPKLNDTLSLFYRTLQKRKPEVLVYPYPFSRLRIEWRRYFSYIKYKLSSKLFISHEDVKDTKYIYYPLHYDPECVTMVLAPNYTNQLALIERLSNAIPFDSILAVKEHIPMIGNRPSGFYEKIKSYPNVKLISPFADGMQMIKNARLTVVITGTAAFEAFLLQKPALCLGKMHYHAVDEGFVYCDNIKDLSQKIREAFDCKPATDETITTYLACLLKESFEFKAEYFGVNVDESMINESFHFIETISEKLIQIAHE